MTETLTEALAQLLGPAGFLTGADAAPYCTDWRGLFHGATPFVLRPADAKTCAEAVALCAAHGTPIVPQGGNTGLCGGATPDASGRQAILLLSRMTAVRTIDPGGMTITAEAGITLQALRDAAAAEDLYFPLSIAAQGSAQLGGILSTNAGGINTLRYGNARDLTLGLEVVLADGRIWHGLRALRKDNTGYALRHLFIGAEGTLGIITAATLQLFPAHRETEVALVALPTADAVLHLLAALRRADGEALHAFEYLSGSALRIVLAHGPTAADPFRAPHPHYVLIELATARRNANLREHLETALADALETGTVTDAVVASSAAQAAALWALRENQTEAQQRAGPTVKNDVSVPIAAIPAFLVAATAACAAIDSGAHIVPFGHCGDGNIHFNLVAPAGAGAGWIDDPGEALIHAVTEAARAAGGSFSAEHGIGQLKTGLLAEWRGGAELDAMRAIKGALDPGGVFNPGKIFSGK